tara:strand:- start:278 stop:430 length:153 start_codon:yes stop_codon:yes gene_type:complete
MYYYKMIPDFFQSPEPITHITTFKTIVGLFIVLFASLVGVEIRIGNDEDD